MKFLLIEDNYDLAQAICARMRLDGHVIDHDGTIAERKRMHAGAYRRGRKKQFLWVKGRQARFGTISDSNAGDAVDGR